MSHSLIVLSSFAFTVLFVGGIASLVHSVFFGYQAALKERVTELANHSKGEANATLFDLKHLNAAFSEPQVNWRSHLRSWYDQAAVNMKVSTLLLIVATASAMLALVGYFVLRHWWAIPLGLSIGCGSALAYLCARRASRIRRVARQLPDVFDTMSRAVRAGQTVPASLQLVAQQFESPISDEFWYCYEQQQLGIPYEVAVRELARRMPVMELRILVVALLVQMRSGGNLIELLTGLSTMARKRVKMQLRMKALTGEARIQAVVLIVLPILAFITVSFVAPDYTRALVQRPWLLGVTCASQLVGALWIRQIVRLRY